VAARAAAPAASKWSVTLILLLFGTTTLVQAFVIPTGSMEDTLLVGDHVLVDKLAYSPSDAASGHVLPYEDVHRGDIIVFRFPPDIKQTYVKRVMGVPGDRLHFKDKQLFLNGHALNEPYVVHKLENFNAYRDNFPTVPDASVVPSGLDMLAAHVTGDEVVVPPHRYFALGDNRDNSSDSRYWGFVPRENIIGKPLIIYWSYDASTEDLSSQDISASHLIDMVLHFPTKTRWDRTFRLIHASPVE
jgi:signal peptidase I